MYTFPTLHGLNHRCVSQVFYIKLKPPASLPCTPSLAASPKISPLPLVNLLIYFLHSPGIQVLKGLSLSVAPGEIVALVGSSGGGKSSIVKLLVRVMPFIPSSGTVLNLAPEYLELV
jgi:ABC-type multidrug transport system fused ATPase/permease subunit